MKMQFLKALFFSGVLFTSLAWAAVDDAKIQKILDLPQDQQKDAKKGLSKDELIRMNEMRKSGGGKAKPATTEDSNKDADAPASTSDEEQGDGKKKAKVGGKQSAGRGQVWNPPARLPQAWDPKPGTGLETVRSRIVNYRHSNCRGGTEREKCAHGQRHSPGTMTSSTGNLWEDITDHDVDGDPKTKDWVETIRFSLKEPLSPSIPLWDKAWGQWHGGISFYYTNRVPKDKGVSEKYNNNNESVAPQQPANDWALHHQPNSAITPYRSYAAWIWKKEDFSSGANDAGAKVSFDEKSLIGLYTQRYWKGWEGIRFIVQDGEQFYISEKLPNDWRDGLTGEFQLRTLVPSQSKWGKWNPKEGDFHIEFDPKTPMEPHSFTDVRGVGWYVFKDGLNDNTTALKWESFECYANVTRPAQPSILTEMKAIKPASGDAFYMATTECAYDLWRKIYLWSYNRGQWALQPGPSTYDRDGDMGSMKFGNLPHIQTEPVTSVTLYDALAWLNVMSEYEGREPVYYTAPSFARASEYEYIRKDGNEVAEKIVQTTEDTVYRQVLWSNFNPSEDLKKRPTIYVKWDADGFRLPTPVEWESAAGDLKSQISNIKSSEGTQPVGKGTPNAQGLFEMAGNVWELVWTYGDKLDPEPQTITVLGGGFESPQDPMKISASPYGDKPYYGNHNIGFRPVRRAKGGKSVPAGTIAKEIPQWVLKSGDKTAAGTPEKMNLALVKIPAGKLPSIGEKKGTTAEMELSGFEMAETETTYRDWKKVYFYALEKGYTFDNDGDMGSMDFQHYISLHSPDEPVTDIGYYDMMVWLNALNEMEGKEALFFADEKRTVPYKNAVRHRPLEYRNIDPVVFSEKRKVAKLSDAIPVVYMRWDHDGYRLPTMAEWLHAYRGGNAHEFPWGEEFGDANKGVGEYAWYLGNTNNKTQEIKKKKPNAYGLYDTAGNALEMLMDSVLKGGKIKPNQTKNPLGPFRADQQYTHASRVHFARAGFDYDDTVAFENHPYGPTEAWAGCLGNLTYADVGFRVMRAEKGAYPPDGIPEIEVFNATPWDLGRKKR